MKRIILVTALVAVSITVISLTSAQQRPTMTPEQLQRVQIRPVPGKDGLRWQYVWWQYRGAGHR